MLKIYNSLSRQEEEFTPINPDLVSLYACGPTVYDYLHIGNLRTSVLMDTLKRTLTYLGYNVKSVMNITDVEDKIENKAKKEGIGAHEVASKYEQIYLNNLGSMNISADLYPRASEHISEQIALIQQLEQKGFTYVIPQDGVYFDISKDSDYGKLGNTFHSDKSHSRIGVNVNKRNPEDFALWKLLAPEEQRELLWESPWGMGYPGWHIECSAMSLKTLTNTFDNQSNITAKSTIDLHVGGEDLKEVHHENEIAQAESALDQKFVNYWVHGAMLNVESDKMSKSLNNFFTLLQVQEKQIEPLALRYFYYTAHYRKIQNFTWEALQGAQTALNKLYAKAAELYKQTDFTQPLLSAVSNDWQQKFTDALQQDVNMPQALAVMWDLLKQDLSAEVKLATLLDFDRVLGLQIETNLTNPQSDIKNENPEVAQLLKQREQARLAKDWATSDLIRQQLEQDYNLKIQD